MALAESAHSDFPLTWYPMTGLSMEGVSIGAVVVCGAGHAGLVDPEDFEISSEGMVSPSLICGLGFCTWHEIVQLEGWSEHMFAGGK